MNIPFSDLKAQYLSIKPDIDATIQDVLNNTAFIGGEHVRRFEADFAKLYGVKHCISVANGTDAIYITMKMLGIGHGDEVITVANSWISTSETITQAGATPVFVDIDEFFTIDVSKLEDKITERTKAIIPVHLYGQMCDMEAIQEIASKHNLKVIEDCAQSHFSEINNQRAGTIGIAGTFSFYPGKNLGAYGDAGAIITNDDDLANKCKMFSNHGALVKHQHKMEGINSRLDSLQAAILNVKLKHILDWTDKRIKNAELYTEALTNIPEVELPKVRDSSKHTFHLYVVKALDRDNLLSYLKSKGVNASIHYPTPLPFMEAYAYLKNDNDKYEVTAANSSKILSLPMFPELTSVQINYLADCIKSFYAS